MYVNHKITYVGYRPIVYSVYIRMIANYCGVTSRTHFSFVLVLGKESGNIISNIFVFSPTENLGMKIIHL